MTGKNRAPETASANLSKENNIPLVMLNTLHVLPNTSLWQRLEEEGRLPGGQDPGGHEFLGVA